MGSPKLAIEMRTGYYADMAAVVRIRSRALDEIRAIFELSDAELAALFSVTRPSITKWRLRGVPVERAAEVERVRELAGYFSGRFIRVRIPQIVRTAGKGLVGRTVLAVIAETGVDRVYAYLERLFSY
jgi:hypothetical protein